MTDLNDVEALRALDVGDMLGAVASMPRHAREGYAAGMGAEGLASADGVTAITFCGMGGSAVAGDVLRSLYRDRLIVPVEVNRSPELPAYAGPRTMVVVSSYSGNTAETLASFEEAVARGCRVLPITSGPCWPPARKLGLGAVRIPGGYMPARRSATCRCRCSARWRPWGSCRASRAMWTRRRVSWIDSPRRCDPTCRRTETRPRRSRSASAIVNRSCGSRRTRRGRRRAVEDPAEREREGPRLVGRAAGARPQRGRGVVRRPRRGLVHRCTSTRG